MQTGAVIAVFFAASLLLHGVAISGFRNLFQTTRQVFLQKQSQPVANFRVARVWFRANPNQVIFPHPNDDSAPLSKNTKSTRSEAIEKYAVPSVSAISRSYLTTELLQTRAAPKLNWKIRQEMLPKNQIVVVTFTVWISAEGRIDHYAETHEEIQPRWWSEALADLRETDMEPATLNNRPVASTMTVEVIVDNSNF
jgi:hypothetical protein